LKFDLSPKYFKISGARYSGVDRWRDEVSFKTKADPKSMNFKDFIFYYPSYSIRILSVFTSAWTIPHF